MYNSESCESLGVHDASHPMMKIRHPSVPNPAQSVPNKPMSNNAIYTTTTTSSTSDGGVTTVTTTTSTVAASSTFPNSVVVATLLGATAGSGKENVDTKAIMDGITSSTPQQAAKFPEAEFVSDVSL